MRIRRNFIKDCRGVVTLEFALIALTVIASMPLLWDLSSVANSSTALSGALRAGVQYALTEPTDSAGIINTIQTASSLPANSVTATVAQVCHCSGTVATCGSTCSGGVTQDMYLTITANYSVPTILPFTNYPTNSFPLSSSTSIRAQ